MSIVGDRDTIYMRVLAEEKEVRNLVIAGLEQIKAGKTKDFNSVCDRLEKKYSNGMRNL